MDYLSDNIIKRTKASTDTSQSSRYRRLSRLLDDEGNQYIERAESITFPERADDNYHTVLAGEEHRLDLIAHNYYGNSLLYWVIAAANDIDDPFCVPSGTVLRIPSKQSLYGYKGVLL